MMNNEDTNYIELTPLEKQIDQLLGKSAFYIQTYRAIDAMNVLQRAQELAEGEKVKSQVRAAIYRNMGQAQFQSGKIEDAMNCFIHSFETCDDNNDKAAVAGLIAGYYLQEGKTLEAQDYADKALSLAKAPELMAHPYQIKGGIAIEEGDYSKALELMNMAAEKAEEAHCLTDLAMIIMDMSVVFVKMGRLETALSEIYRAERYVKECRNWDLYLRCAIRRAKIMYKMGRDEEAKQLVCALEEHKG